MQCCELRLVLLWLSHSTLQSVKPCAPRIQQQMHFARDEEESFRVRRPSNSISCVKASSMRLRLFGFKKSRKQCEFFLNAEDTIISALHTSPYRGGWRWWWWSKLCNCKFPCRGRCRGRFKFFVVSRVQFSSELASLRLLQGLHQFLIADNVYGTTRKTPRGTYRYCSKSDCYSLLTVKRAVSFSGVIFFSSHPSR